MSTQSAVMESLETKRVSGAMVLLYERCQCSKYTLKTLMRIEPLRASRSRRGNR
jgi:hypothetical protein